MPPLSTVAFLGLAALTLGSAGLVAFSRNIIHSALALLGTFLGVAGLYVTLSADFLAATQVLVYVGGTLILILFAVMLTSRIQEMKISNPRGGLAVAFALVTAVLLVLGRVATRTDWPAEARPAMPSTAKLGHAFLGEYLLPFELGSIVLLAAMIGAVVLARRAVRRSWERE
ncbi:NADH-quinone oxidoreductase subunit J [Sorangium sp. So ce315]|jgi:NADH-quinone oxidoreductase subunit J|uniref:NADH-quinone oxidoreductase subunit J n=1 Tax=Sorangium cellulosum TaxID=56 RepID=A0A150P4P7_SORCE|nr:NADH dehydrogenase [Sorangium cellulosum]